MTYYDDYIREKAEKVFDQEKATFTIYDSNHDDAIETVDEGLSEQIFYGAMNEMVAYLYERRNELDGNASMGSLFEAENVERVYITALELAAPTIVVEYDNLPDWFEMENADLREFYWHPNPSLSGEWTAGYFQPR